MPGLFLTTETTYNWSYEMKIKELFSSHHRWTKNALAKNNSGERTDPLDSDAVRFCLLGAVEKCYPSESKRVNICEKIKNEIKAVIPEFNDSHSFKEIKALVEKLDI